MEQLSGHHADHYDQRVRRLCRSKGSWDRIAVKLQRGICRHLTDLLPELRSTEVLVQRSIGERAQRSIEELAQHSIVVQVAIAVGLAVGSIDSTVAEVPYNLEHSSGLGELPDCGVQRYHKLGSWDTCWDQLQPGI